MYHELLDDPVDGRALVLEAGVALAGEGDEVLDGPRHRVAEEADDHRAERLPVRLHLEEHLVGHLVLAGLGRTPGEDTFGCHAYVNKYTVCSCR